MSRTARFRLKKLGPNERISDDGFEFSNGNIDRIDQLLEYAVELHEHTGELVSTETPSAPPNLLLDTGGGFEAGERFFYKITIVDDDGHEGEASSATYVDMPSPVQEPQSPTPSLITGSGTLAPGQYFYTVSAYKDATTLETRAPGSCAITITGVGTDNSVLLTLPSLPQGADGFNIYRRAPNGTMFQHLASTSDPTYTDDGSVHPDCDRTVPASNSTNNDNAVVVSYPGATPALPEGWGWRIYRTDDPSNWDNSYLIEIVDDEGITEVSFVDVGEATQVGGPPDAGFSFQNPGRIQMTDALEVTGWLPTGTLVLPRQLPWVMPGLVQVAEGVYVWPCDYEEIDILFIRPYLVPEDSYPAATDIIIDVLVYRGATPQWLSIFDDDVDLMPRIEVGQSEGDMAIPVFQHFVQGDVFSVDILQAGGGATPMDTDLTLNVMAMTRHGSETETYEFLV